MTPLDARLIEENEQLRRENEKQAIEIKLLRDKIDLLVKRLFGSSSEKLDSSQLELLLEGSEAKKPEASRAASGTLEADNAREAAKHRQRKAKGELGEEALQRLPTVDIVIDPDEVKADPEAWRYIHDDEVTRQLDYEPARYVCRRIIRRRYVKRDAAQLPPVVAELPTLLERSMAGPGLLASILVDKYCQHLPLYRQEQLAWVRHGLRLPRQSMARWVGLAAEWLKPIYQRIIGGVLDGGYVQIDETMIRYLQPGHGQARQGYLWAVKRPGQDVFFHWETSRASACLGRIIPAKFSGVLQSDGYANYPAFARQHRSPLTLACCWAHTRRGFYEARDNAAQRAHWLLRQIAHLYHIEARLRRQQAGPKLREAVRCSQSRVIVQRIGRALERMKHSRQHLPSSSMGKAIDYALKLWPALQVYLQDGRVEIDTNQTENAIRPTAIGKKNFLFIGEAQAGQRSAIVYTIIEACRRQRIDPFEYLRDVFTRMPMMAASEYHTLTPEAWAKARGARMAALPSHARSKPKSLAA